MDDLSQSSWPLPMSLTYSEIKLCHVIWSCALMLSWLKRKHFSQYWTATWSEQAECFFRILKLILKDLAIFISDYAVHQDLSLPSVDIEGYLKTLSQLSRHLDTRFLQYDSSQWTPVHCSVSGENKLVLELHCKYWYGINWSLLYYHTITQWLQASDKYWVWCEQGRYPTLLVVNRFNSVVCSWKLKRQLLAHLLRRSRILIVSLTCPVEWHPRLLFPICDPREGGKWRFNDGVLILSKPWKGLNSVIAAAFFGFRVDDWWW